MLTRLRISAAIHRGPLGEGEKASTSLPIVDRNEHAGTGAAPCFRRTGPDRFRRLAVTPSICQRRLRRRRARALGVSALARSARAAISARSLTGSSRRVSQSHGRNTAKAHGPALLQKPETRLAARRAPRGRQRYDLIRRESRGAFIRHEGLVSPETARRAGKETTRSAATTRSCASRHATRRPRPPPKGQLPEDWATATRPGPLHASGDDVDARLGNRRSYTYFGRRHRLSRNKLSAGSNLIDAGAPHHDGYIKRGRPRYRTFRGKVALDVS